MNPDQLYKELTNSEELKDIPLSHIIKVAFVVIKILQSNGMIFI